MEKPKFLYHGSRFKVEILKPHQAKGSPEENGTEFGIYAYEKMDMVIPFSLTINPFENGSIAIYVDDETSHVTISTGTLDDNAIGYIYKVPSDTFEKIDDKQWLSNVDIIPVEFSVFETIHYIDKISFTGEAKAYRERSK